jgi:hypothetical protein
MGDLQCFERRDKDNVPGCPGVGDKGKDYCFREDLNYVGDNGSPLDVFPLHLCEGDCDNDSDCAGALKCFQREATEVVPGCPGVGRTGKNHCFDDGSTSVVAPPSDVPDLPAVATYFPGDLRVNLFEYVIFALATCYRVMLLTFSNLQQTWTSGSRIGTWEHGRDTTARIRHYTHIYDCTDWAQRTGCCIHGRSG